jgi:hypothetical protein
MPLVGDRTRRTDPFKLIISWSQPAPSVLFWAMRLLVIVVRPFDGRPPTCETAPVVLVSVKAIGRQTKST